MRDKIRELDPPFLIIINGGFSKYKSIESILEESGIDKNLFDVIDPSLEIKIARGVFDLKAITEARLKKIVFSRWDKARKELELEKAISRRTLLVRGPLAMIGSINKPVVDKSLCSHLSMCKSCISSCPTGSLSGKPPDVNYESCIGCGLCYSICPIEAISSPFLTWRSIEGYARSLRLRSQEPAHLLIMTRSDLENVTEINSPHPTLILPVISIRDLTPLHIMILGSYGFTPHILARSPPRWIDSLTRLGLVFAYKDAEELEEGLALEPKFKPLGVDVDLINSRLFARLLLSAIGRELSFDYPVVGDVDIDEEACVLCGACAKLCVSRALTLVEENDKVSLHFEPDRCIGCKMCEAVCPEKAITASWIYRPESSKRILTSTLIAKCLKCGVSIGAEKMVRRIEEKLKASGVKDTRHLRLCSYCKQLDIFE